MGKVFVTRYKDRESAVAEYLERLDRVIEEHRDLPAAKADAYRAKYADALTVLAGGKSNGWVTKEAELMGRTVRQVATDIAASHEEWQAEQAELEAIRVAAKAKIRSLSTPKEMSDALNELRSSL